MLDGVSKDWLQLINQDKLQEIEAKIAKFTPEEKLCPRKPQKSRRGTVLMAIFCRSIQGSMGRTGLGLPWPRLSPKKPSDPPLPRSP